MRILLITIISCLPILYLRENHILIWLANGNDQKRANLFLIISITWYVRMQSVRL